MSDSNSNGNGALKRARSSSPVNGQSSNQERQQGTGKKQNTGRPNETGSASARSGSAGKASGSAGTMSENENSGSQREAAAAKTEKQEAANASSSTQQSSTSEQQPAVDAAAPQITIKALIVTQDASIIIGKAGAHIKEIREKAGARVSVSDQIPGNPERILNVTGPLDAVSKVCFQVSERKGEVTLIKCFC